MTGKAFQHAPVPEICDIDDMGGPQGREVERGASIIRTDGSHHQIPEYQYHMRLRVFHTEKNFGPGVSALMELVRERGSLSAACKEMNMAYSKAWKIIQRAEDDLGFSLMEGSRGGEHGGRTVLTEQGEAFLGRYRAFEEEAREAVDAVFKKYYGAGTHGDRDKA